MKRVSWILIFLVTTVPLGWAKGRRPADDDKDNFPDYNRLEMHPKVKEAPIPPDTAPTPEPPHRRGGSLNQPLNPMPEDSDIPRPLPAAVPVPSDSSEPPITDDMMGTLIPSTTPQSPPATSR